MRRISSNTLLDNKLFVDYIFTEDMTMVECYYEAESGSEYRLVIE